jgi:tetratricopeptide (TPR) repeat protein
MRVERVVERLNGEFTGIWEGKYYQARVTFQQQIPVAAECDLVVGALAAAEESLALAKQVSLTAPDNLDWRRDVSIAFERIGNIKTDLGDKPGALAAYEEMLSIDRQVAEADSGNLQREREVILGFNKVGDTKSSLDDPGGALESYEQGPVVARRIAAADPESDQALRNLAVSLEKVGAAKLGQRRRRRRIGRVRREPLAARGSGRARCQGYGAAARSVVQF